MSLQNFIRIDSVELVERAITKFEANISTNIGSLNKTIKYLEKNNDYDFYNAQFLKQKTF